MIQYTVEFYKFDTDCTGKEFSRKVVMRTGKATMEEAFQVAISNGHRPDKYIKMTATPEFKHIDDNRYLTTQSFHRQNGDHVPGSWCWCTVVWCGAVPCSPDFKTDTEAIEYGLSKGWIELI